MNNSFSYSIESIELTMTETEDSCQKLTCRVLFYMLILFLCGLILLSSGVLSSEGDIGIKIVSVICMICLFFYFLEILSNYLDEEVRKIINVVNIFLFLLFTFVITEIITRKLDMDQADRLRWDFVMTSISAVILLFGFCFYYFELD